MIPQYLIIFKNLMERAREQPQQIENEKPVKAKARKSTAKSEVTGAN